MAKKYVLNLNRYTQIKLNYFSNYILLIRICLINKSTDHDEWQIVFFNNAFVKLYNVRIEVNVLILRLSLVLRLEILCYSIMW